MNKKEEMHDLIIDLADARDSIETAVSYIQEHHDDATATILELLDAIGIMHMIEDWYWENHNAIQNTSDMNAWIYIRKSQLPDSQTLEQEKNRFRKLCEIDGFSIVGETVVEGDSEVSFSAIQSIVHQVTIPFSYILTPDAACLSNDRKEYLELRDIIEDNDITLAYYAIK